jgi:hypothetical protein
MLLTVSPWDLSILNSGLLGAIFGLVGAVVISTVIMLYSLHRTERADRSVAFETAMLHSAEELSAALVELRHKLDPLFVDNWAHQLELAPEHAIAWARVAQAHASALAVDGRDYKDAAEKLTSEILMFTEALKSAVGRDADTREGAYGWHYQRCASYDSVLQAADRTLARWAEAILDGLADLRRGATPRLDRPTELSLTTETGEPIEEPNAFKRARWYPQQHLIWDATELAEDGVIA